MDTEATEIVPGLFQGSRPKPGCYNADVIVLMAQEYQPHSHEFLCSEAVVHAPIGDNFEHMSFTEQRAVNEVANYVAHALHRGKRVLVTCNQGWNRSGVVSALALRKAYGVSPDEAIQLIRRARGPLALSNPQFLKYIRRA